MAKIILIGGNELQKKDGIEEYVADLSNGVLDLLPYAQSEDAGAEKTMLANDKYSPLGVTVRTLQSQDLTTPPSALSSVVYLIGGDSDRLSDSLGGSALWAKITDEYQAGSVSIVGGSAGAMILFGSRISEASWRESKAVLTPGLGLIKGDMLLVPHWNKFDDAWHVNFLDTYDRYQVIGIDENTAIAWEYGEAQVIGLGKVLISDQLVRNEYESGDSFKLEFNIE